MSQKEDNLGTSYEMLAEMINYLKEQYPHHELTCNKCRIVSHDGKHSDRAVKSCYVAGQCEILEGRRTTFSGVIKGPTPNEVN
jgi:hypothetical protein